MSPKKSFQTFKEKANNWLYDHMLLRKTLENGWIFLVCTLSALIFAIGFNMFMDPGFSIEGSHVMDHIVSGGVSGMGQVVVLFCEVLGWKNIDASLAYSILYFVINIPVLLLAFFKIGKKFAIFTLINVGEVSLFMGLLNPTNVELMKIMSEFIATNGGGFLGRAIFGGVCTGLSTALAFKVDISTGGVDIIAFYVGLKKRTTVGKYSAFINAITITSFTLLECINNGFVIGEVAQSLSKVFFSGVYLLMVMLVIDTINVRNKKLKVEVVTERLELGKDLISAVPHAATLIKGEGVYSGKERYIFTMVVSSYELKNVIHFIKKKDPMSFVEVTPLSQVYGRFYTKPVK